MLDLRFGTEPTLRVKSLKLKAFQIDHFPKSHVFWILCVIKDMLYSILLFKAYICLPQKELN